MFNFTHIKQGFWEIFRKIFEESNLNSETILKNNSAVNVLLTFFPYNNTNNSGNNNWFYGGNMLSFCYIKQGFWEIFRKIFEGINKLINNTFEIFIRKLNFITEKFTNNNYEEVLNNNLIKLNNNFKIAFINSKFTYYQKENHNRKKFFKDFILKNFLKSFFCFYMKILKTTNHLYRVSCDIIPKRFS